MFGFSPVLPLGLGFTSLDHLGDAQGVDRGSLAAICREVPRDLVPRRNRKMDAEAQMVAQKETSGGLQVMVYFSF